MLRCRCMACMWRWCNLNNRLCMKRINLYAHLISLYNLDQASLKLLQCIILCANNKLIEYRNFNHSTLRSSMGNYNAHMQLLLCITYVAVPGRNQRLFLINFDNIFDLKHYNSEMLASQNFKFGLEILQSLQNKYLKFGTKRLKHIKNVINLINLIKNGLIFDFYLGLPHIYYIVHCFVINVTLPSRDHTSI